MPYPDVFPQYTASLGDGSYQIAYAERLTLAATTATPFTFPAGFNPLRIRSFYIEDQTQLLGGAVPSTGVAAYFRIDGMVASAGNASDGSASRILRPATGRTISRFSSAQLGISVYNPNAAQVQIELEFYA